jgi:hypothetical protein
MTTAPHNDDTHETTPADGGNAGTTPPQAANQGTTPTPEGGNAAQPDIDKIIQKRLERERKKWEAESEEKAKRARMDEADRLKADLADRDARIAEAEQKALTAERKAALTGRVADPTAALRLLDDAHVNDDGTINVDALLKAYPFLTPATGPTPTRGAGGNTPNARKTEIAQLEERMTTARTRTDRVLIQERLNRLKKE